LPRVAVVGAAAVPGSRILDTIARAARASGDGRPPVAIDRDRGRVATAEWRLVDPTDPALVRALRDVDVAVWVAAETDLQSALRVRPTERRDLVVRTAQTLVTAAAAAGVSRLVVVTSAKVYGATPDNPVPLPEDSELNGVRDGGVVGDLLAVEEVIQDARRVHPGLSITAVRPAALVGPGIDTVVTRHFEAPRLLTVKGANPAWQFCHVDDLASGVRVVCEQDLGPVVTVGAPGWLSQEQVESLTGMRRVQLSEATALVRRRACTASGCCPPRRVSWHMRSIRGSSTRRGCGRSGGPRHTTMRPAWAPCWSRSRVVMRSPVAGSTGWTRRWVPRVRPSPWWARRQSCDGLDGHDGDRGR